MAGPGIQRARLAVQIGVYALIGLHLVLYYGAGARGVGSVGFEEFFRCFLQKGVLNAGTVLVMAALFASLVLGRVFCGWACHFGALQEWVGRGLGRLGLRPPTIDAPWMRVVPVLALALYFVWPIVAAWRGAGVPAPSVDLARTPIWEVLPGAAVAIGMLVVDGVLLVAFFGTRGFCRLLCPWGAMLGPLDGLARGSVTLVGKCTECRTCVANCEMGIDVQSYVAREGRVTASECVRCLRCVSGCPARAIALRRVRGWTGLATGTRTHAEARLGRGEQAVLVGATLAGLVALVDVGTVSPLLALGTGALAGLGLVTLGRLRRRAPAPLGWIGPATPRWARRAAAAVTAALVGAILVVGTYKGARDLAARWVARDDVRAALPALRVASAIAPWNANLLAARAVIHLRKGELVEARALAVRAVRADRDERDGHAVLAEVALRGGDLPGAAAELEQVVRLAPGDGAARLALCRTYETLGRAERFRGCMEEGLRAGVLHGP